ncbi:hypothetical protein KI387_014737, partial [Taxus chinensis]
WSGSVNDSRLLRNSNFYRMCEGGERLNGISVPTGLLNMREYIIGDGGYLLLPWLIMSFSGSGPFFTELDLVSIAADLDQKEKHMMMEGGLDSADYLQFMFEDSSNVAIDGDFSIQ